MSGLLWFILGNVSGAISMTAIWVIIGSTIDKKNNNNKKGDE